MALVSTTCDGDVSFLVPSREEEAYKNLVRQLTDGEFLVEDPCVHLHRGANVTSLYVFWSTVGSGSIVY